jgi:hypothetical protein
MRDSHPRLCWWHHSTDLARFVLITPGALEPFQPVANVDGSRR